MSIQKNLFTALEEEKTSEAASRQIESRVANDTSPEPTIETTEQAQQTIAQLQQAILSDDNFDFSQLEAAGAGTAGTSLADSNESDHLSTPIIELPGEPADDRIGYQQNNEPRNFELATQEAPASIEQNVFDNPIIDDSSVFSLEGTTSEPDFLGDTFANTTEDFLLSVSGKADTSAVFSASTHSTQYGEISYNEQGEWQYTLNNKLSDVQELDAGDSLNESIAMITTNGDQFIIEVTINGSNDQAFIAGTRSGTVKEDTFDTAESEDSTVISTGGELSVIDIDTGEARFAIKHDIKTSFGSAEVNAQGQWRYELNNDLNPVQSLKEGQKLSDYFSVNTLDGTSKVIHITIEGSNDTPILKGSNAALLNPDFDTEVSGQLGIEDPDFGESHFQVQSNIAGRYGVGSIDESGLWHYQINDADSAISALSNGTNIFDTFKVLTADNTETQVIIRIANQPEPVEPAVIELTSLEQPLIFSISSPDHPEADVYIWNASDPANADKQASPDVDHIAHFVPGDGGDILQLNDLLIDSSDENNLEQFLHFSFDGQDTTLEIHPEGVNGGESHFLVLDNINLTSFGNSDGEIIHQLINNGNLDIAGL